MYDTVHSFVWKSFRKYIDDLRKLFERIFCAMLVILIIFVVAVTSTGGQTEVTTDSAGEPLTSMCRVLLLT